METGSESYLRTMAAEAEPDEQETEGELPGRRLQKEKDEFLFSKGELLEGHPVFEYVQSLAQRVPRREGYPLNLVICPDWREVNAGAFPDGTICISGDLIKEAETEEALIGVIGHEYVHSYRQHVKKQNAYKSFSTLLHRISLTRGHEYEADLKGALMDLEEAGVNPLGYKAFLEKISQKNEWDLAHGSGTDRVLNIATAMHLIDFKSLTQELTPIPVAVISGLNVRENTISYRPILRPISASFLKEEKIAERRKERDEAVEKITTVKHALLAIEAISHDFTYLLSIKDSTEVAEDPGVDETIELLFEKMLQLLPAELSDEDREILGIMALEFFTTIPVLSSIVNKKGWIPNSIAEIRKSRSELFGNPEKLVYVARLTEQHLAGLGIGYADDVSRQAKHFVDFVVSNKVMGEITPATMDSPGMEQLIGSWSSLFASVSEKLDIYKPINTEGYDNRLRNSMVMFAQNPDLKAIVPDLRQELADTREIGFFDLGVELSRIDKINKNQQLKEIKDKFLELSEGLSLNQITKNLQIMEDGKQLGLDMFATANTNRYDRDEQENIYLELGNMLNVWLLHESIYNLPQFVDIPDAEKRLVLWGIAGRNGTIGYVESLEKRLKHLAKLKQREAQGKNDDFDDDKEPDDAVLDMEEIQARVELLRFVTTKDLFKDEVFRLPENVVLAYRYLADHEYYKGNIELISFSERNFPAEYIFLDFVISNLKTETLPETLVYLNELESAGVKIFDLLKKHPDISGVLVGQINAAINNDLLRVIPLADLTKISKCVSNPFLKNAFQRYIKELFWKDLSFQEKLDILYAEHGISDLKVKEEFVELDVRTKEQYDLALSQIKHNVDDLFTQGDERAGVLTLLTQFNFRFRDVNVFLKALLSSQTNEQELRRTIYGTFKDLFSARDEKEMRGLLIVAESALRSLYSLDEFGKQVLLRQVLTSEFGALPDKAKREKFLNYLFDEWITKEEDQDDLTEVLQKIKEALVAIPDWSLLYFALNNALIDKITVPPDPAHRRSWGDLYEVEQDMEGVGLSASKVKSVLSDARLTRLPKSVLNNPRSHRKHIIAYSEQQLYRTLEKEGVLEFEEEGRLNSLQFIKQGASKVGALGPRFLQLAPQFMDVPDNYEQEFSEVYDGLKGQSKLAAINLLEREWPELWDNISEVQERIGGGSIVTVYKTLTTNGEQEVLKVRNPNIQYHLNESYRFAASILDYLSKKHGGGYTAAAVALEDIKNWIEGDINFKNFLEHDQTFRGQNQDFKPEGFKYSIKIPKSKGPESQYFIREEYIEGVNLTQWNELKESGNNMKEIISLIVKNYIQQIQNGLVHSDVHPGNFRVTAEGEVAILDRNFYLTLSEQEQVLIFSLFNPLVSTQERVGQLFEYLNISSEVDSAQIESLLGAIAVSMSEQDWPSVHAGIVKVKQLGVRIPLNFTLLFKNFNSLEMMSKKAGFGNISEAFFYETIA